VLFLGFFAVLAGFVIIVLWRGFDFLRRVRVDDGIPVDVFDDRLWVSLLMVEQLCFEVLALLLTQRAPALSPSAFWEFRA
jgi:hypothetical protein